MMKVKAHIIMSISLSLLLLLSYLSGSFAASQELDLIQQENLNSAEQNAVNYAQQNPVSRAEASLSDEQQKLGGDLLQLVNSDLLPAGRTQNDLLDDMDKLHQIRIPSKTRHSAGSSSQVYVYIKLESDCNLDQLDPIISKIVSEDRDNGLLAAWVDFDKLNSLASLNEVLSIRSVLPPLAKSGSVNSQGDAVHRADLVRERGTDGSGVKVGIISDGANHWTSARDSGDLPDDVVILEDDLPWGGEEGTALMEIVYDLAPGAKLYFHDCGTNILEFNRAIDELIAAGCTVVCDDITWTDEPFFQDGIIASHVKELISDKEVVFASSAGNYAQQHYQGIYKWSFNNSGFWHNFGRGHSRVKNMEISIPAQGVAWIILEWNESFGHSRCNYDLFFLDPSSGEPVMASEGVQNGSQDPYEFIGVGNDSDDAVDMLVAIKASNHPALFMPRILEMYIYGAYVEDQYITPEDSIFGHPAVPGVLACGAVDCHTPDQIEDFSSRGPVTMLSGKRSKPDLCGADRVDISGAGGFYSPLYGTSASAPHVAAIAALLWSKYPDLEADEVRQKLLDSAIDLGKHGRDNIYGYGRVDALNACAAELEVESLTSDKSSPRGVGEVIRWTCEARGEGELSYSWQVFNGRSQVLETDFSSDNFYDWTPDKKGKYQIRVTVTDESGRTVSTKSNRFLIR